MCKSALLPSSGLRGALRDEVGVKKTKLKKKKFVFGISYTRN